MNKSLIKRRSNKNRGIPREPRTPVSRLVRSNYITYPIYGASTYLYGIGVNSTGSLTSYDTSTITTNVWTGTSLGNVYDAYRIMKFTVTVFVLDNMSQSNSSAGRSQLPILFAARDYDDISSSVSTVLPILNREDASVHLLDGTPYTFTVVPKLAPLAYGSATASGYLEPKPHQWVSTSTGVSGSFTDPDHYGIKFFLDMSHSSTGSGTQLTNLVFYIKCWFEVKHSI